MAEASSLCAVMGAESDSPGFSGRLRRIAALRDQMQRENRRSATPFSHPLASRGPLWTLREQIRDVSRIADAIAHSAELAAESRVNELCNDLRRLMKTQQQWTERLENQIWRLESQSKLMRRLQQVLLHNSPSTDQLWELCELIAKETQALPDGLLLLPEPGHRIVIPGEGINRLAATAIERARFCVFAARSIFPDLRGAQIAAGAMNASAHRSLAERADVDRSDAGSADAGSADGHPLLSNSRSIGLTRWKADTASDESQVLNQFSQRIINAVSSRPMEERCLQLFSTSEDFSSEIDRRSVATADKVVPPQLQEFYQAMAEEWASEQREIDFARSLCQAFALSGPETNREPSGGDDRLVMTHKLRWHDQETTEAVMSERSEHRTPGNRRVKAPHFRYGSAAKPALSVFTMAED